MLANATSRKTPAKARIEDASWPRRLVWKYARKRAGDDDGCPVDAGINAEDAARKDRNCGPKRFERRDPILCRHRGISGSRGFWVSRWLEGKPFRRSWKRTCGYAALAETLRLPLHVQRLVVPPDEAALQGLPRGDGRSLSKRIRARLARSVREGELPEHVNCEALATSASRS
jgi:hypothetical protein